MTPGLLLKEGSKTKSSEENVPSALAYFSCKIYMHSLSPFKLSARKIASVQPRDSKVPTTNMASRKLKDRVKVGTGVLGGKSA